MLVVLGKINATKHNGMKEYIPSFPVNQIKEDRSFLFWFSMFMVNGHLEKFDDKQVEGVADLGDAQKPTANHLEQEEDESEKSSTKPVNDIEKVLSWLRLALDQVDFSEESFEFDFTPSISDVRIDEVIENVFDEISDDIGDMPFERVEQKLKTLLEVHSKDGYSKYSMSDTHTPQSKKLFSSWLLTWALPIMDPTRVEADDLKPLHDTALIREERGKSRLKEKEALRNVLVYNMLNNVKDVFPSYSDYKLQLITGIMVSGLGFFVSKEKHDSSYRSTNYREYLVKSVRGNLRNYKEVS